MHLDPMAQPTNSRVADARVEAVNLARRYVRDETAAARGTTAEFLRFLGAVNSDDKLTAAGQTVFCATDASVIEFTILNVPGGSVLNRVSGRPGTSVLEQLIQIETAVNVANTYNTVVDGLAHQSVPQIPHTAVREALLNAIIHRDWFRSEPIEVRWTQLDSMLEVRSPGGFPAAITKDNVLSNRAARYPALADLFRAIGLVEKQGLGVDRMYQAMIVLGARPPMIDQVAGPFVETILVGGKPVLPVLDLMRKLVPEERKHDVRIVIILYLLFQRSFVTTGLIARELQSTMEIAKVAVEAALQTSVLGHPLIKRVSSRRDAWMLGDGARRVMGQVDPIRPATRDFDSEG